MRRLLFLVTAGVAVGFSLAGAQGPAATDTRDLPIRRVVLYKSGIGFFEHVGRVTGNQRISVPFTSTQLDDVLKTLTVLDLDGGAVSSVGYNTDAPLDRRLEAIGLPIADDASFPQLLRSLRGARVEVARGATTVSGRLLTVDGRPEIRDGNSMEVDYLSVLSDAGTVHSFELGPATSIHFADPGLSKRVDQYLANVAAAFDRQRRALNIVATGSGTRRVYVSYISETPVWKATYRVVLPEGDAKPMLQGWAIVDNTGSADWSDVELSLVAGAPQSFRQPLSQPMYLRRPDVPLSEALLPTPQADSGAMNTFNTGLVVDASGTPLPGASVRLEDESGNSNGTVTDANGNFSLGGLSGRLRALVALPGFSTQTVTFDASAGARVVLPVGSQSETMAVSAELPRSAGGGGGAYRAAARVAPPAPPPQAYRIGGNLSENVARSMALQAVQATPRDLGDLFEYKLKSLVTIPRNQSAMVPIVSGPIDVKRVSTWTASDGMAQPRRALWITNNTGVTLDGGSVTVLDRDTFSGEGLVETLKSGDRRLVSYAVDLAMKVQAETTGSPKPIQQARIAGGVMTIDALQCSKTKYTTRNSDGTPRQLVIEHPRSAGWTLVAGKPEETTLTAWRFVMPVGPRSSESLTVSSYKQVSSTLMLTNTTGDQLEYYMKSAELDPATRAALGDIQQQRAKLDTLQQSIAQRQREADSIANDQQRLRNNMTALKGSAEEKQLLQRYVKQLNDQEDRLKTIRDERADLERQLVSAQEALNRQIEGLTTGSAGPIAATCP